MPEPVLTPLQRFLLAFYAFFAVLFRLDVAEAVYRLREAHRAGALPSGPVPRPSPTGPLTPEPDWRDRAPVAAPPAAPPASGAAAPAAKPAGDGAAATPAVKPASAVTIPLQPAPSPAPAPAARPPEPAKAPEPTKAPEAARAPDSRAALQLLAVLQREGRLVDFIEEDLAGFPDAAIGAAARTVHAGCKRAIEELFRLEPVYREPEGARVTVAVGFDPAAVRLTGQVVGKPPFQGSLKHHGWRARDVKLPPPAGGQDPAIVAPAEVEL